jgi:hypothetical protein
MIIYPPLGPVLPVFCLYGLRLRSIRKGARKSKSKSATTAVSCHLVWPMQRQDFRLQMILIHVTPSACDPGGLRRPPGREGPC